MYNGTWNGKCWVSVKFWAKYPFKMGGLKFKKLWKCALMWLAGVYTKFVSALVIKNPFQKDVHTDRDDRKQARMHWRTKMQQGCTQ